MLNHSFEHSHTLLLTFQHLDWILKSRWCEDKYTTLKHKILHKHSWLVLVSVYWPLLQNLHCLTYGWLNSSQEHQIITLSSFMIAATSGELRIPSYPPIALLFLHTILCGWFKTCLWDLFIENGPFTLVGQVKRKFKCLFFICYGKVVRVDAEFTTCLSNAIFYFWSYWHLSMSFTDWFSSNQMFKQTQTWGMTVTETASFLWSGLAGFV